MATDDLPISPQPEGRYMMFEHLNILEKLVLKCPV